MAHHRHCDDIKISIALFWMAISFIISVFATNMPRFLTKNFLEKKLTWINVLGVGILLGVCFFLMVPEIFESFRHINGGNLIK